MHNQRFQCDAGSRGNQNRALRPDPAAPPCASPAQASPPALATPLPASAEAASPLLKLQPTPAFDVRQYGAAGDGKTLDTQAINHAIQAAADAGGGTVHFPAGTYLSFSIRLRSHVGLNFHPGATLLAADSPKPGETHRL